MASLLGSMLIGWAALWNPDAVSPPAELSWGILVIFGFGASVISGMLYKIVLFWSGCTCRPVPEDGASCRT